VGGGIDGGHGRGAIEGEDGEGAIEVDMGRVFEGVNAT